jgi:hypothetical protein
MFVFARKDGNGSKLDFKISTGFVSSGILFENACATYNHGS